MKIMTWSVARTAVLFAAATALPAAAQSPVHRLAAAGEPSTVTRTFSVTAGTRYRAGSLHRMLWGNNYRRLWTAPITLPVLDLARYAGGLRPTGQGGGRQTLSLHLQAADGREFSFRSVDKNGLRILPPDLQASIVGQIWQDEVSAFFPAGSLIVPTLSRAAGVPAVEPRLFVMPDDPALGEYRARFAGMLGTLEQWPTAPYDGASQVITTDALEQRVLQNPAEGIDSRALLRARLLDLYLGDSDRGETQWLWLKRERKGGITWQPLPIDRDYAFVSYGGLMVDLFRRQYPKLVRFGGTYSDLYGLNARADRLDRRLLGELDWSTWDAEAHALASRLTDSVIEASLQRLPSSYQSLEGSRLGRLLRERRDRLPQAARQLYRMLARDAEVYGTDQNEVVTATRGEGTLELSIQAGNQPYYVRRFQSRDTKEIRLFLGSGVDTVTVTGSGGPGLRLIGDAGTKVVSNVARRGWTALYAPKHVATELKGFRPVAVDRKVYREPNSTLNAPAPRESASWWWYTPALQYNAEGGALIGVRTSFFTYGFRRNPYSTRLDLSAGYGSDAGRFGGAATLDLRRENSGVHFIFSGRASGADVRNFYGLGNETQRVEAKSFYKVYGDDYQLSAAVAWPMGRQLSGKVGPVLRYTSTDFSRGGAISTTRPYGSGEFGAVGGRLGLDFDSRDVAAAATRGAHVAVEGTVYPAALDVQSAYGGVSGEASTYLTAPISLRPTLALRVGGQKVWGTYPYTAAAFVGGNRTVRGLTAYRFEGDASAYGNAELRLPISRLDVLAPFELGIFGLADVGRVWLKGESSDTWHSAFGGGISLAFLNARNTVTAAVARGDGQTGVYLGSGFMF
jgi:hypothetical protein